METIFPQIFVCDIGIINIPKIIFLAHFPDLFIDFNSTNIDHRVLTRDDARYNYVFTPFCLHLSPMFLSWFFISSSESGRVNLRGERSFVPQCIIAESNDKSSKVGITYEFNDWTFVSGKEYLCVMLYGVAIKFSIFDTFGHAI